MTIRKTSNTEIAKALEWFCVPYATEKIVSLMVVTSVTTRELLVAVGVTARERFVVPDATAHFSDTEANPSATRT